MNLSWGMELEFGDVKRDLILPDKLGLWNYNEKDIVNQRDPYWGIAADPLGINPPFGGEINTIPTYDYREQIVIFEKLKQFFIDHGCPPTASCVSNTHVHVHVPGLKTDINLLKHFLKKVFEHQFNLIKYVYGESPKNDDLYYLKYDSGRKYSQYRYDYIMKADNTINFYLRCIQDADNVYKRYLVNFLSLPRNDTLEFRFFRSTVNTEEIENIMTFCNDFMSMILYNTNLMYEDYKFPKLDLDEQLFYSWQKTKKRGMRQPICRNYLRPI